MNEDKSKETEVEKKDIPTSSREKIEIKPKLDAKPKLKVKPKPKKKKYPIVLVAENYIVYKGDKGNVWVRTSKASSYKVSEEYEV